MNKQEYENITAFHPGYYISDIIIDLEMTQEEFAKRLNITPKNLSDLVNGKASISDNIAKSLAMMLGTSVDIWLNLQRTYDQKVLEIKLLKTQKAEEADLALIDYAYFTKLGVVKATKDKTERISELLKYFAIASFTVFKNKDFLVQFRQVQTVDEKVVLNSNAWVQTVFNIGKTIDTKPFSEKELKRFLPRIKEMTLRTPSEVVPQLKQLLAECGVALVLLPSLKNSGVYGATKWVNNEKVVVGITDRRKYADVFWFSLLHELGHVMQRKKTKTLVDFSNNDYTEKFEKEADEFAEDLLIDREAYELFTSNSDYSESKIRAFASVIKVHPGIVVGRLQKEGLLPYTHFNNLKQKYDIDFE